MRNEQLLLIENESCLSLEPFRQMWRDWGDVPLTAAELERIVSFMLGREHGKDLSWDQFTASTQPLDDVRAKLGLRADRPVWALFTSSDDEAAGEADWASPFASQGDWIARTIAYARANPQLDLVIRVHPNTGSKSRRARTASSSRRCGRCARTCPRTCAWSTPRTRSAPTR